MNELPPKDRIVVKVSKKEADEILRQKKLKEKSDGKGIGISIDALRMSFLVFIFIVSLTYFYYTYWGDTSVIPMWKHDTTLFQNVEIDARNARLVEAYQQELYDEYVSLYKENPVLDSAHVDFDVAYLASLYKTQRVEQAYYEAFALEGKTEQESVERQKIEWIRVHIAVARKNYREAQFLLEKLSQPEGIFQDRAKKYHEELTDFLEPDIW